MREIKDLRIPKNIQLSKSLSISKNLRFLIAIVALFILLECNAYAMHIAEGYLSPIWCLVWGIAALPFLAKGVYDIKKLVDADYKVKIFIALAGAYAFVLTSLKMPSVTGSSSHPTGIGFGAIFFGPFVMSVISLIVLIFQALLLAHGGITTLGANVFSMGIVGTFAAYGTYKILVKMNVKRGLAVFLAVFMSNIATYSTTALQLSLYLAGSGKGFMAVFSDSLKIFALTQIPIAISESILTVLLINGLSSISRELPGFQKVFGEKEE